MHECMCAKLLQLCSTLCGTMDCNCQVPLSMVFARREYWSVLPSLLQGIFLTQGSNLRLWCLLHRQAGSLPLVPPGKPITQSNWAILTSPCWLFNHLESFAENKPGVGCCAPLQGIFPTQGLNSSLLSLLHWQVCSLPVVPPGHMSLAGYSP